MNPVCGSCSKEMKADRNGVTVAPEGNPSWFRSGDRFRCTECEQTVIVGFGEAYDAEPRLAEVLMS